MFLNEYKLCLISLFLLPGLLENVKDFNFSDVFIYRAKLADSTDIKLTGHKLLEIVLIAFILNFFLNKFSNIFMLIFEVNYYKCW